MASKYWLKMYHEAIHDPKLASLPNNLWRRFWECCLLAGELDEGGFLPEISSIAWAVRVSTETLRAELGQLAQAGFVELKTDRHNQERWFVSNFAKRQEPSSSAKRMREYRKRKKEERETDNRYIPNNNSDVTNVTNRNGDILAETITAVSAICRETLWSKTERDFEDAAYELIGRDASLGDIKRFGEWWKDNGWHKQKPVLKNILDSWQDFKDGRSLRNLNGADKQEGYKNLISVVSKYGRRGLEAKEELGKDEWKIVERMGGWGHVRMLTPNDIKFKYYQARKEMNYV